jgi:4-amino-4-deoxy-L-arabinose transferase-like glycosyltransferase
MGFTSARERRLWVMAGSCLLLIYSSLYIVRPLTEWLRAANLLRLAVGASFLLAAVWVGLALLRKRPGWRVWMALGGIALGYVLLLSRFELPEERLHFLEYGIVGGLVYTALLERQRATSVGSAEPSGGGSKLRPAVLAFLITGAAGWIDEGIQEILPNRFYDLRDVAMNAAAGALAVFSIWIVGLATRAGGRVEAPDKGDSGA